MQTSLARWTMLTLLTLAFSSSLYAQTAKVQFVHASPDTKVSSIDLYVDGQLLVDDLRYAEATALVEVPTGAVQIAIAPGSSQSAEEAVVTVDKTFFNDYVYWGVIYGVTDPASHIKNPEGLDTHLGVSFQVRSLATVPSGEIRLQMFNASLDSDALDFWVDFSPRDLLLRNDVSFGQFSHANQDPARTYTGFLTPGSTAWPRLVELEPIDFSPYGGESILEVAIGFFDREVQYRNRIKWLWVHEDGTTQYSAIRSRAATVQFISASPDPELASVDIWVDGFRIAEGVEYGRSTPAVELTADHLVQVAIVPAGSADPSDPLHSQGITFDSMDLYQGVIAGVLDPAKYAPNPSGEDISLNLFLDQYTRWRGGPENVAWRMFHSRIDLPAVDFWDGADLTYQAIDNLTFGHFSGYEFPSDSHWGTLTMGDDPTHELYRAIGNFVPHRGTSITSVLLEPTLAPDNAFMMAYLLNGTEYSGPLGTASEDGDLPKEFALQANYPNPFNPSTQIQFDVPAATWARLEVYNVLGQRIATLLDGFVSAGRQTTTWRPSAEVPSGVYLYSLATKFGSETRTMTLLQ